MKTSEIRDLLLQERALYQQSLKDSEEAVQKISEVLDGISEEDCELLSSIGIDYRRVKGIDLERIRTDAEYVAECRQTIDAVILALHDYLRGALGV